MFRLCGNMGCCFFVTKEKCFAICGSTKKNKQPYIGIVEGKYFDEPFLIQEDRSRMKIMLFDPAKDLPAKTIENILQKSLDLYKTGVVKLKE